MRAGAGRCWRWRRAVAPLAGPDRLPDQEQRVRGEAVVGGERVGERPFAAAIDERLSPGVTVWEAPAEESTGAGARRRGQRRGALGLGRDLDRLARVDRGVLGEAVVGGDVGS